MKKRRYSWIAAGLGLALSAAQAGAVEERYVSLDVQDLPLREILSLLSRQTGVEIALEGGGERHLSMHVEDRPLEQLLRLLCEAAGCALVTTERGYVVRSSEATPEPLLRVTEWLAGPLPAAPSPRTPHAPLAYSFLAEAEASALQSGPDFALELRLSGHPWPTDQPVRVAFHYQGPEDYDGLLVGPNRVGFVRSRGGLVEPLGTVGEFAPPANGEAVTLTLTCRGWEKRALINHELQARAFDDSLSGGRLGYHLPLGVTVEGEGAGTEAGGGAGTEARPYPSGGGAGTEARPYYQPVEEPYLTDDFMRADGAGGEWETWSGQWNYSGPRSPEVDPARSANPFAYRARGSPAHAVVGQWFWEDYHFEVAVKPTGPGAVGLSFYVQDERNFLLFRWAAAGGGGERQFWLVRNGVPQRVAAADGGYEPGQWVRLAVRLVGRRGEALIDGHTALVADLPGYTQGRVGLYAEGTWGAFFDDVLVTGTRAWYDDLSPFGPWENVGGMWCTVTASEDPQRGRVKARTDQPAMAAMLTGQPAWRNYRVEADVRAGEADQVGLCFYHTAPGQYVLFRLLPPTDQGQQGRAQLFSVIEGRAEQMAEAPAAFMPTRWNHLRVEVFDQHCRAFLNGQVVCEGFDARQHCGRAGLYTYGPGEVTFKDFSLTFLTETDDAPDITEQFTRENTMSGWADPAADWVQPVDPRRSPYWHRGDFFGDVWVRLSLRDADVWTSPTGLILSGDGLRYPSGYTLEARPAGQGQFDLLLWRGAQSVGRTRAFLREAEALRFERKGPYLLIYADDTYLFGFHDPHPLPGRHVGLGATGREVNLEAVQVRCSNMYDTAFSHAPVDWRVAYGVWETMARWPCQPGWTWFGGALHATPTLWTKRSFEGDLTLEFWAALQMDRNDEGGYAHPSDINATICGNGRDGVTGYHFLFATENNTVSQVWRGDTLLTENRQAVFDQPNVHGDLNRFHRHWFHVRIERRGPRLSYWVDDRLVATVTDPRPLPGGPVALWTRNNGLLVARVRVWYERVSN